MIDHGVAWTAFAVAWLMFPLGAHAADVLNGEQVAKSRCGACHIVGAPDRQREVADALPFDVSARSFGFDADRLALSLRERHPRMNLSLTRSEANDVAAYMSTLAR